MKLCNFVLLGFIASFSVCGCGVKTERKTTVTPSGSTPIPTVKPASKKPPVLTENSTPKETVAYTAYYKAHGYTITQNTQSVSPDGRLLTFHFKASRHTGGDTASASADIDAVTNTITVSESTTTNY